VGGGGWGVGGRWGLSAEPLGARALGRRASGRPTPDARLGRRQPPVRSPEARSPGALFPFCRLKDSPAVCSLLFGICLFSLNSLQRSSKLPRVPGKDSIRDPYRRSTRPRTTRSTTSTACRTGGPGGTRTDSIRRATCSSRRGASSRPQGTGKDSIRLGPRPQAKGHRSQDGRRRLAAKSPIAQDSSDLRTANSELRIV